MRAVVKNRMGYWVTFCAIGLAVLSACGGENTNSNVAAPGTEEAAKTKVLEAGANLLQDKAPLNSLNAYLDGFHFYSGNPQGQMEAHHYCGHLNEDMIQCVIFDGNASNAKIMGVEYIVSRNLFAQLPPEEKHLWHSHVHEVRAGSLIAPGIPEIAEHELMEKLAGTYGKTWHTWHTDQKLQLPLGTPMLMMGFVDGHSADPKLVADRDRRFDVSSERKREQRSDIEYPPIDPDADAWQKGIVPQLELKMTSGSESAR
jgi:Protein of unknown function (DUF1264)